MRIAIPCENERICTHFGHAPQFGFFTTSQETGQVEQTEYLTPPAHEPGVLPQWISQQGADVVLAGGMGGRAVALFEQAGVRVVLGVQGNDPCAAVEQYVQGTLASGDNACGHDSTGGSPCAH